MSRSPRTAFRAVGTVLLASLTALVVLLGATLLDRSPATRSTSAPQGWSARPVTDDSAGRDHAASVPGPRAERGAAPLGAAGCEPRQGAVFVAPNGSDSAPGSFDAPLASVAAAVARAPEGGTIVLRGGEYHERVVLTRPVTMCALRGEVVWFDGASAVSQWSRTASGWSTPWPYAFDSTATFTAGETPADPFVDPARPMAAHPEMVFVDGTQLRQVSSDAAPGPGEFHIDAAERSLTIGTDPAGRDVRVADLQQAIVAAAPGVRLEGFGVRRYANSLTTFGAVYLGRGGNVARDVVVEDVATIGFTISDDTGVNGAGRDDDATAPGSTLEHVTVRNAGLLAVHANWADGLRITGSRFVNSNSEGFNTTPVSGAVKVTQSRHVLVADNEVTQTNGATGIWMDESVVDFTIVGNTVRTGEVGITAELSSSGVIAENEVTGQDRAVVIYNSEQMLVALNRIHDTATADLWIAEDHRRQTDPDATGHDPRHPPGDPTNTWRLRDVRFVGNTAQSSPLVRVFVLDPESTVDPSTVDISDNAFVAPGHVAFAGIDEQTQGLRRATLHAAFGAKAAANVVGTPSDADAEPNPKVVEELESVLRP